MEVYTYGGLDAIVSIFNASAMVGKSDVMMACIRLGMLVSTALTMWKLLLSPSLDLLGKRWLLPMLVIGSVVALPGQRVQVVDVLKGSSRAVDNVPYALATMAHFSSSVGYSLTRAIETVFQVAGNSFPGFTRYTDTGLVFGNDKAFDMDMYRVSDANLRRSIQAFSSQCVKYDVLLNRYSLNELECSSALPDFFCENSSASTLVEWAEEDGVSLKTCREAAAKIRESLGRSASYLSNMEYFQHLGSAYQTLAGLQIDSDKLLKQQLLANSLCESLSPEEFASRRTHLQQTSTYRAIGATAGRTLVAMRVVIEALIYASFLLIIPAVFLPRGLSIASNYLFLLIWIQLWPPFYAILSYIMQIYAHPQASGILLGATQLSGAVGGWSMLTSVGLANLYNDVNALAGYLSASVPFISYAIVKGGVPSFIHLASSMMTPAHNAASSASSELSSGNYSLGNISGGNFSYGNASEFQRNLAPSMQIGYETRNSGSDQIIATDSCRMYLSQSQPNLRFTPSLTDAVDSTVAKTRSRIASLQEAESKNFSQSVSQLASNRSDLSTFMSKAYSSSAGYSDSLSADDVEAFQKQDAISKDFAKVSGLSEQRAHECLIAAQVGTSSIPVLRKIISKFGSVDATGRWTGKISLDDTTNEACRVVSGENWSNSWNQTNRWISSDSASHLSDEGQRLAKSCSKGFDQAQNASDSLQETFSKSSQIQHSLSDIESHRSSMAQNLSKEFQAFAMDRFGHRFRDVLNRPSSDPDLQGLIRDFVSEDYSIRACDLEEDLSWIQSQEAKLHSKHETAGKAIASLANDSEGGVASVDRFYAGHSSSIRANASEKFNEMEEKHQQQIDKKDPMRPVPYAAAEHGKIKQEIQEELDERSSKGIIETGSLLVETFWNDGGR